MAEILSVWQLILANSQYIIPILVAVAALDRALLAMPSVAANNTEQAVLNVILKVIGYIQGVIAPKQS